MAERGFAEGPLGPGDERDACALTAWISRSGRSERVGLLTVIRVMQSVRHRAGFVNGECDGAGILVDLPRVLWAGHLEAAGKSPALAYDPAFTVAHLFGPPGSADDPEPPEIALRALETAGYSILCVRKAATAPSVLGPLGRKAAPALWQVALRPGEGFRPEAVSDLTAGLTREGLSVVSLSSHSVVYKVRGDADALYAYYRDLTDERLTTAFVLGHLRFSTNTESAFSRVQPFRLLGHNGEINTIARLREEARELGIDLPTGGSDSQDLDGLADGLIRRYGFSLAETVELLFPPVPTVLANLQDAEERAVLKAARDSVGPLAQGPAALVFRHGDEVVCSLDALGLRPLWFVPTQEAYWVTSERTIVPFASLTGEPRPLAPGEKLAFRLHDGRAPDVIFDAELRRQVTRGLRARGLGVRRPLDAGGPLGAARPAPRLAGVGDVPVEGRLDVLLGVFGFDQEDLEIAQIMADEGRDPIGSLGYDGPIAALATEWRQVSDFLHETVAVVTNPAIDREREGEHFSTDVVLGSRPPLPGEARSRGLPFVRLDGPLVLEPRGAGAGTIAAKVPGLTCLDDLSGLPGARLRLRLGPGESLESRLAALAREACERVLEGAVLLTLDDGDALDDVGGSAVDPTLAVAHVDRALRGGLRRRVSILVRSGGVRRLHDIMCLLALGADAIDPYLLWRLAARGPERGETALSDLPGAEDPAAAEARVVRLCRVLTEGIEKVMSTMGTHELRGYARALGSLGLAPDVAGPLGIPSYFSAGSGHTLARFEREARERAGAYALALAEGQKVPPARMYHIYPKLWKRAAEAASGRAPYASYESLVDDLEARQPVSLRHLIGIRTPEPMSGAEVALADAAVGEHRYPLVVSSMSFGSQGETAYRAYLEGAARAGVLCLNGEGGEFPDLLGRYPRARGIQVASGRFGISAPLLAGARYLEIKIGQGAKPGEGGHLPARKVSAKVARARNAQAGVDLISPSNNHDLYSIEDLRELIDELREVSPEARIIVKVPVVPGIGTIAVGIVKAGADVLTLSGFDGGTGACRRHSARHVGLPAEIGLLETHGALLDAGLRSRAELWCDGGMKTAADVLRMILMGANRVAFGTLAMVAVGCTICRACQADTCHVGITTQVESLDEALAKGLRRFVPRDPDAAAESLSRMLTAIGESLAQKAGALGALRVQDLVGHGEHLVQVRGQDRLDVGALLVSRALAGPAARLPAAGPASGVGRACAEPGPDGACEVDAHGTPSGADTVRMVGTALAGAMVRAETGAGVAMSLPGVDPEDGRGQARPVRVQARGVLGQGLAVFHTRHLDTVTLGGGQDGVAKGCVGGRVAVLRARCPDGVFRDGSVGKSFAYGAQGGRLFVQGDADTRACVRFSGGRVVFGGFPHGPLDGTASRANLKGFAFEYMTGGTAVCLGDPGPWLGAGMTGGRIYVRLWPEFGLGLEDLKGRVARGSALTVDLALTETDRTVIVDALSEYADLLEASGQGEEAGRVRSELGPGDVHRFARIFPKGFAVAQDVSTE